MSGTYTVLVIELPTEPEPGEFRKIRIQIGCDFGQVDLVNLWLDRLERHRIITPVRVRNWEFPPEAQEPDTEPTSDGDGDDSGPEDPELDLELALEEFRGPAIANIARRHGLDPAFLAAHVEKLLSAPVILDPDDRDSDRRGTWHPEDDDDGAAT